MLLQKYGSICYFATTVARYIFRNASQEPWDIQSVPIAVKNAISNNLIRNLTGSNVSNFMIRVGVATKAEP